MHRSPSSDEPAIRKAPPGPGRSCARPGAASVVVVVLERDVQTGIAPLVRTTFAHLVREVVVIEVDAIVVVIEVLPVLFAVHEDLHGLAALLEDGNREDE